MTDTDDAPTKFKRDLADGVVELELNRVKEGLLVAVYDVRDGRESVWSVTEGVDFPDSAQKRSTFRNKVVRLLKSNHDGIDDETAEAAGDRFDKYMSALASDNAPEDKTKIMRTDTTTRLISETADVRIISAEQNEYVVTLEHDGHEADLRFTVGEWANTSPAPLREQYANQFHEVLDLEKDEWVEVRDEWQERQRIVASESMTSRDSRRERILRALDESLTVHAERDKLRNGTLSAWYDPSNTTGDGEVPDDAEVVWVPSKAIQHVLDDLGFDPDAVIGSVSTDLSEADVTYSGSRGKGEGQLWPFRPEQVGITDPELEVHRDEDDTEVEI